MDLNAFLDFWDALPSRRPQDFASGFRRFVSRSSAMAALAPYGSREALFAKVAEQGGVPTFADVHASRATPDPASPAFAAWRERPGRFATYEDRARWLERFAGEALPGSEVDPTTLLYSQGRVDAFSWAGLPCLKSVFDLALYAQMIGDLRPATIVEFGGGVGGGSAMLAGLAAALGVSTIVYCVELDGERVRVEESPTLKVRKQNWRDFLQDLPALPAPRPWLMIEDCHDDTFGLVVEAERLMTAGDYLVVEDAPDKQDQIRRAAAATGLLVDTRYTDFFGVNATTAFNGVLTKRPSPA